MHGFEEHIRKYFAVYIFLSVATYVLAFELWRHHHPLDAIAVIWWSPFPCPPGVPC